MSNGDPEEGDKCPTIDCGGTLAVMPDDASGECQCRYTHPPCRHCTETHLECTVCGWMYGDEIQ